MILARNETLIYQVPVAGRVLMTLLFVPGIAIAEAALLREDQPQQRLVWFVFLVLTSGAAVRALTSRAVTLLADGRTLRIRLEYWTVTIPLAAIASATWTDRILWHSSGGRLVLKMRDGSERSFNQIVGAPTAGWIQPDTPSDFVPAVHWLDSLVAGRNGPRDEVDRDAPVAPRSASAPGAIDRLPPSARPTTAGTPPPLPAWAVPSPGTSADSRSSTWRRTRTMWDAPLDLRTTTRSAGTDWLLCALAPLPITLLVLWSAGRAVASGMPLWLALLVCVGVVLTAFIELLGVCNLRMKRMLRSALPAIEASVEQGWFLAVVTVIPPSGTLRISSGRLAVLTIADGRVSLVGAAAESWPADLVRVGPRMSPRRHRGIELLTPDGPRLVSMAPRNDPTCYVRPALDVRVDPWIRRLLGPAESGSPPPG
jgi:hypothetical protein